MCRNNKMEPLVHTINQIHTRSFRPGREGSVGEVVVQPRFRQSTPFMPWAYDPYWAGKRANKLGSNVQDGDTVGYDNKGGPAKLKHHGWVGNRSFKHQYGRSFHDLVQEDKATTPWVSSIGDYEWRNKVAHFRRLKSGGNKYFSIVPGPYQPAPDSLLRGASQPRTQVLADPEELGVSVDIVSGNEGGVGSQPVRPDVNGQFALPDLNFQSKAIVNTMDRQQRPDRTRMR